MKILKQVLLFWESFSRLSKQIYGPLFVKLLMNYSEALRSQTNLRRRYLRSCWGLSSCTYFRWGGTAAKGLCYASCVNLEVFFYFWWSRLKAQFGLIVDLEWKLWCPWLIRPTIVPLSKVLVNDGTITITQKDLFTFVTIFPKPSVDIELQWKQKVVRRCFQALLRCLNLGDV